jgi:glycosyltransferase involved in cell wall biosynthesis
MIKYTANIRIISGSQTGIARYVNNLLPYLNQLIITKTPRSSFFFTGIQGHIWDIFAFIRYRYSNVWLTSHRGSPFLLNYVVTIHDLQPIISKSSFSFLYSLYYNIFIKLHAKKSKHIFTVSEKVKKDIIDTFNISPSKISVIYPGYEHLLKINEINFHQNKVYSYALMYGNISRIKQSIPNIVTWLEANSRNDLKLIIIGGIEKDIESHFYSILNNNKIIYIEYANDDELFCYLKNALYLYFNSPYEGFGIPALEAVYFRIPVLYSAKSSVSEFIMGYGIEVDHNCINSIKDGLIEILNFNVDNERFDMIRLKILNRCSWKKSAKKMIHKLNSI